MTHPVLRRAVFEDVDEIRALVLAAYARWEGVTPRPPQPVRADYGRAFRAHRFDLLVENGALVGLVETVAEGDELLIVNVAVHPRSEEHTSELQSLMRISYAVFCLKKKKHNIITYHLS